MCKSSKWVKDKSEAEAAADLANFQLCSVHLESTLCLLPFNRLNLDGINYLAENLDIITRYGLEIMIAQIQSVKLYSTWTKKTKTIGRDSNPAP